MPQIHLLDGKKIPFSKSISGFELTKKIIGDKVDISEIENISSENIISNLFHLTLIGDLVSVYMADNLDIDPYDITAIENLKKLLKE